MSEHGETMRIGKEDVGTIEVGQVPAVRLVSKPAPIVSVSQVTVDELDQWQGLPPDLLDELRAGIQLPTGFNPVVTFTEPGHYFLGYFQGYREGIGPNESRLYDFVDATTGEVVSLWGGYVLDTAFNAVNVPKNSKVFVRFLGMVPTKGGTRTTKRFNLIAVPPKEKPAA